MRRLLMKQFMRMKRNGTLSPKELTNFTVEEDNIISSIVGDRYWNLYRSPNVVGKLMEGQFVGYERGAELHEMRMDKLDRREELPSAKKYIESSEKQALLTLKKMNEVLNKVNQNPRLRANVNAMLANIESSRKIRDAFSKAKPEQWKIMERLIETRNLDPIRSGNIVTKLPTHAMVSALTDRDFAKLVNADYKKRLDFKYARVINKGNVEKAMISLREHILGEQYHLSEYQRAQLEILMDDMTVDDFDNFYKSRFGHIVNEVFYSSDSRMMMQTTPYELFDDDVEPPKPGRTMGITEKDKIFNKFVSSLQVYMGVDDDTLDALVWEKLGRKG